MANFEEEDEEQLEESHKPFCPKCGSTDIRGSRSHRTLDYLLRSLSLRPYRCRSCRKRFYMRKPAPHLEPELEAPERENEPGVEAVKEADQGKGAEEVKPSPPVS